MSKIQYYEQETIDYWKKMIYTGGVKELPYIQFDDQKEALKQIIFEDDGFVHLSAYFDVYDKNLEIFTATVQVDIHKYWFNGEVEVKIKNMDKEEVLSTNFFKGRRGVNKILKYTLRDYELKTEF